MRTANISMNLTDLPLEIVGEIAGESSQTYHSLILAYPAFARSLTLGDRLDFAEKFGYDCRVDAFHADARIMWYLNGKVHRADGPAIVCSNGSKSWYIHGVRHRVNAPAVEYACGSKSWYINGEQHRVDGPAVDSIYGKLWYINGMRHRIGGPAVEYDNGSKYWYMNGKLHRLDGPAVIDHKKEWWIDGVQMSEEEHTTRVGS